MVVRWIAPFAAGCVFAAGACAAVAKQEAPSDPKLVSVFPFTGSPGTSFIATVRGNAILDASAVFLNNGSLKAVVEGAEAEPPEPLPPNGKPKPPVDLVRVRITVAGDAAAGRYSMRLVTPRGVSNSLFLCVVAQAVTSEPEGSHETPETAVAVASLPAVINGRIRNRGETDYYAFQAKAGETVTFQAVSGLPSPGAPGGNASGFDPALSIYQQSGSWFDAKRINRIAFNDEPLWVIGGATDAYLVHAFEKAGSYLLRIEAFSGQGGPDYGYQLSIVAGRAPEDRASSGKGWEERGYTRHLGSDRLSRLTERGGVSGDSRNEKAIENYRPGPAAVDPPRFQIPGILEGGLTQPGEAQRARFHVDGPADIAMEIETPALAPPLFNPIVRLLGANGQEVATNIFTGRGACNGEMNKSIQAKTIVPLRDAGDYTVEIRDTTADLSNPGFRYRLLIRPQIPHVGNVKIDADHVNLARGDAQSVRVMFDREEGFTGAVAVTADSLPPGVTALAGADFEPDKDPPMYKSKRERYTPRAERAVVVFTAAADATLTGEPHPVRLLVRPIVDGHAGAPLGSKTIPFMVVMKR